MEETNNVWTMNFKHPIDITDFRIKSINLPFTWPLIPASDLRLQLFYAIPNFIGTTYIVLQFTFAMPNISNLSTNNYIIALNEMSRQPPFCLATAPNNYAFSWFRSDYDVDTTAITNTTPYFHDFGIIAGAAPVSAPQLYFSIVPNPDTNVNYLKMEIKNFGVFTSDPPYLLTTPAATINADCTCFAANLTVVNKEANYLLDNTFGLKSFFHTNPFADLDYTQALLSRNDILPSPPYAANAIFFTFRADDAMYILFNAQNLVFPVQTSVRSRVLLRSNTLSSGQRFQSFHNYQMSSLTSAGLASGINGPRNICAVIGTNPNDASTSYITWQNAQSMNKYNTTNFTGKSLDSLDVFFTDIYSDTPLFLDDAEFVIVLQLYSDKPYN